MRRNRSKTKQESRTRRQSWIADVKSLPLNLHVADEDSLGKMLPGDILLLPASNSLRDTIDPVFFAALACPACGALGLITSRQYFGAVPVICVSKVCSCRFRIADQSRLVYLPAS